MYKKAQVSIEYTLIIGLILFALTLAVGVAFFYSTTAKHQITMNQIEKVGKKISETADSVYYLGNPSQVTLDLTMPESINEIIMAHTIGPGGDYILFKYKGPGGEAYSIFNTKAEIDNTTQSLNNSRFMAPGLKHLIVNVTQPTETQLPQVQLTPYFAD